MSDVWTGSYWQRAANGRVTRRRVLSAGAAASGFVAFGLAGCGSSNNNKSGATNTNSAAPSATSAGAASATSAASGGSPTAASGGATGTPGASAAPQTVPTAVSSLKTGGTIQFVEVGAMPLDPVAITTYRAQHTAGFHYARLFRFAAGNDPQITLNRTPVPDLVEKYEVSGDGLQYTMHLRQGVMYHPPLNRPLTSADVVSSYQYFTTNAKNTNAHVYDPIVDSLTAPDDSTLVWKLKLPYAPFLNKLANTQYLWILSKDGIDGKFDLSQQPIGVGPWIFVSQDATAVTWKKNPNYWNKGLPYADGAVANIIPDTSTQEAQLQAGKIDSLSVPPADLDSMKKAIPKASVVEYVPDGLSFLFFHDVTDPNSPFKDDRVRQAASLAIDRKSLIDNIYQGRAVWCNLIPPGLGKWYLDPNGKDIGDAGQWFKADPQKAKQLLAAAGHSDTQFTYYYPNNAYGDLYNAHSDAMRGMLSDAGFKLNVVTVDYLKDWIEPTHGIWATGNLPATGIGHGLQTPFTDPDDWLTGMLTKGGNRDHSHVDDADLTALIKKQQVEQDESKRLQEVYDATRAADNKMYYVPTVYTKVYIMNQPWVQNFWACDDYDFGTEEFAYISVNNK